MPEEQGTFRKSDFATIARRDTNPNGMQTGVEVEECSDGGISIRRLQDGYTEFGRSVHTSSADNTLLEVARYSRSGSAVVPLRVTPELTSALTGAVKRARGNGVLSDSEARQFDNLRAYINNHSGDGVLDAKEQNIIVQRANNIAPENNR